ncbi:MAG: polysaccharide deacetylase family protein [Syntrophomonadaceae bacterium]|nr:polysaccharide deacetylase family protein [Syntrophomonadaceae bacterium]
MADNATSASYSWSFVRNSEHKPPGIPAAAAELLAAYPALYLGDASQNQVYLTFDCGYELGYAPAVLDTLAAHDVPALFFLTGHYVTSQPDLVLRMRDEGHMLGNHTYNHPDPTAIAREELARELESLNTACIALTGQPLEPYMRPPAGKFSAQSLRWTGELGYTSVFWSMAFHDWDPNDQPGADWVYQHVTANIHPGAVILLHIVSQSDTEALERIIIDLKAQGYTFAALQ